MAGTTQEFISALGEADKVSLIKSMITTDLAAKVDVVAGKGLSAEDFTAALKAKLAALEGSHFKGTHADEAALLTAHPTADAGSYAYVLVHNQEHMFIWDGSAWDDTGTAGAVHMSDAQIKTQYENNPETNPFSDAEKVKLAFLALTKDVNLDHIHDNTSMFDLVVGVPGSPVPTHVDLFAPLYLDVPQVIGADVDVNKARADLITIGSVYKLFDSLSQVHPAELLEDKAFTAGDLRALKLGVTYKIPVEPSEGTPGSGTLDLFASKTDNFGIKHAGHPHINAVLVRFATTIWTIIVQEWTGTVHQPTIMFLLDLDPTWADHTGIGSGDATSFSSEVLELEYSIGDRNAFGAQSIVQKIQDLETLADTTSRHVADIQGEAAAHVDIIQEFKVHAENNGAHFCVVRDDPSNADHFGKDLWDGHEHKVLFEWQPGFDPCDFDADGNPHNSWCDVGTPRPSLWFQQGVKFRKLVDPTTGTAMAYGTVLAFIMMGSIVTVQWDATAEVMNVIKVEHGTAHQHTDNTAMLKDNGSTPYKEVAEDDAANGALFVDVADHLLKFKDHAGVVKTITMA